MDGRDPRMRSQQSEKMRTQQKASIESQKKEAEQERQLQNKIQIVTTENSNLRTQVNQQAAIIKQQTEVIKSLISNNADLKNELEQIKALVSAVEEYQSPRP